jgi:RNA polymerase sigma factor (sigma-70 family)
LDELLLIEELKQGNENAFKQLVDTYNKPVYNTALGLVQNEADAEDIAQEVFIQVLKNISSFKSESKLGTWIYRIAVNKALEWERKKKAKKRFAWFGGSAEAEPADFNHPGILAENREKAALLFHALKKIPEQQRTAFILNKTGSLSYQEVAAIMQTSVGAVESLLQRARQNLRRILEAHYDEK